MTVAMTMPTETSSDVPAEAATTDPVELTTKTSATVRKHRKGSSKKPQPATPPPSWKGLEDQRLDLRMRAIVVELTFIGERGFALGHALTAETSPNTLWRAKSVLSLIDKVVRHAEKAKETAKKSSRPKPSSVPRKRAGAKQAFEPMDVPTAIHTVNASGVSRRFQETVQAMSLDHIRMLTRTFTRTAAENDFVRACKSLMLEGEPGMRMGLTYHMAYQTAKLFAPTVPQTALQEEIEKTYQLLRKPRGFNGGAGGSGWVGQHFDNMSTAPSKADHVVRVPPRYEGPVVSRDSNAYVCVDGEWVPRERDLSNVVVDTKPGIVVGYTSTKAGKAEDGKKSSDNTKKGKQQKK